MFLHVIIKLVYSLNSKLITSLQVILACILIVQSAAAQEINNSDIIRNYSNGKYLTTKNIILNRIEHITDNTQKFKNYELLFEMCVRAFDYDCIYTIPTKMYELVDKVFGDARSSKYEAWIYKIWLSSTVMAFMPLNNQKEFKFNPDVPANLGLVMHHNLTRYTEIQIKSARVLAGQDRYEEAAESINRAKIGLFAFNRNRTFEIASIIKDIISELIAQGNSYEAINWFLESEVYLQQNLPKESPDYAQFLELRAHIATFFMPINKLADLYKEAYNATKNIEYRQEVKDYKISNLITEWSAVLAASGKTEEASKIIELHPLANFKNEILSGRNNTNPEVINYVAALIFVNSFANHEIDVGWEKVLERARDNKLDDTYNRYSRDYIDFAQGLIQLKNNKLKSKHLIVKAARSRIDFLSREWEKHSDNLPLINTWDRALIEAGIIASHDLGDDDLLIVGLEILDRSYLSSPTDHKSILAAQDDNTSREIARTWTRQIDMRHAWEVDQLKSLTDITKRSTILTTQDIQSYSKLYSDYIELEKDNRRLMKPITSQPYLPSIERIKSELHAGEAFIKFSLVSGLMVKYCVTKDKIFIPQPKAINVTDLLISSKTLKNSLQVTGSPDELSSPTYPTKEAKFLWDVITNDIDECVSNSTELIFNTPDFMKGVPIEALIYEEIDNDGEKTPLGFIKWSGLKWPMSYVASAQDLIVSRKITSRSGGDLPYLGIGNPNLSKNIATASRGTKIRAYTRGGNSPRDIYLSDLGDLPSTGIEISSMAKVFGDKSVELSGVNDTEAIFRSKAISRFNILHFATHALIREELPGVAEASLVFTPGNSNDKTNDGLLQSSEIAALNLNAKLVVMSACNSSNVDSKLFGNQLRGLVDAFSLAGVPTIIAALWSLDDRATLKLMNKFSEQIRLNENRTISELRRLSIQSLLQDIKLSVYHHPRFWAGLIIMGDGGTYLTNSRQQGFSIINDIIDTDRAGGETLDLKIDGNKYYASIIGAYNSKYQSFSSVIESYSDVGKRIWASEDYSIGSGPINYNEKSVVFAGYTDKRNLVIPVVTFTTKLKGLKEYQINIGKAGFVPILLLPERDSNRLLIEDPNRINRYLMQVSSNGFSKDLKKLSVPGPSDAFREKTISKYLTNENFLVGSVYSDTTANDKNPSVNGYGVIKLCSYHYKTTLSFYSKYGDNVAKDITLDQFLIKGINELSNNRLLISGVKTKDCSQDGRAAVYMIDKNMNVQLLWEDKVYSTSEAVNSSIQADEIQIVGVHKQIGLPFLSMNEQKAEISDLFSPSNPYNVGSAIQIKSPAIIRFNTKNGYEQREIISSGYSDAVNGVIFHAGKIHIYGHIAGQPRILQVKVQ